MIPGTGFLMGAGIKFVSNLVNNWMHNSAEKERNSRNIDSTIIEAQVQLAKELNRDFLGKLCRMIIFIMMTGTFCYITIYCMRNPLDTTAMIENTPGFFGRFKNQAKETAVVVHSSGYVFGKAFIIIEMVIGSYVVPSRRR